MGYFNALMEMNEGGTLHKKDLIVKKIYDSHKKGNMLGSMENFG